MFNNLTTAVDAFYDGRRERQLQQEDALEREIEDMHEDGTIETLIKMRAAEAAEAYANNDYAAFHQNLSRTVVRVANERMRLAKQLAEEDEAERLASAEF